jgi:hypothetical protein
MTYGHTDPAFSQAPAPHPHPTISTPELIAVLVFFVMQKINTA